MRSRVEAILQAAALAILAWALVRTLGVRPAERGGVDGEPTTASLGAWSAGTAPAGVHARLSAMPTPLQRDWLAALAHSGTRVTWSGDSLVPIAMSVEPIASPGVAHRVRVAAPKGAQVRLADAAGDIDTLRVVTAGAAIGARTLAGHVSASVGGSSAASDLDAGGTLHPVLVLGRAAWESRFLIVALEEAGWRVTARLLVAPGTWVEQGALPPIDTSRFSVVVVLDTAVGQWGDAIARYARSGGGVVLAGRAAAHRSLRAIAPGRPGEYVTPDAGALPDSAPRRALGVHPVTLTASDALVLERRGAIATVAARRLRLGRIMQVGYDDTWRWRMGGGDDAPRAHRAWWSRVLSSVAYAPAEGGLPTAARDSVDAAPFAHLVDALGASRSPARSTAAPTASMPAWMLVVACALLLASWGARRARGAP